MRRSWRAGAEWLGPLAGRGGTWIVHSPLPTDGAVAGSNACLAFYFSRDLELAPNRRPAARSVKNVEVRTADSKPVNSTP